MNIQIFGTTKCFDTKKALRYFKERKIPVQFVNLKEKGLSKGEYNKVKQAVGGLDAMIDTHCKDQDTLALIQYAVDSEKDAKDLRKPTSLKNAHRKKRRQSHRRLRAGCLEDLGLIILPLNDERLGKTYNRPQQRDMRY